VISPARVGAFLTGAVGVVAGFVSGTKWIYAHASPELAYVVALMTLVVAAGIVGFLALWRLSERYKLRHWWSYVGVQLVALPLIWGLVNWLTSPKDTFYVMAWVFVAFAVAPISWLSYQLDNANHKQCPMCCERIKARARICRHCGSRIRVPVNRVPVN
jgi:hypothetical protein